MTTSETLPLPIDPRRAVESELAPAPRPRRRKAWAEALALAIMAAGIIMVCQPWLHVLFRWGFLVTILGIIAFTIAAHLQEDA